MPRAPQASLLRYLLALVQLGEGTRDTRRRVPIETRVAYGEDPARVRGIIRQFSTPAARLLTLSADSQGMETIEVTHESLFDNWQLLRSWLDESRDDIRFHRRLSEAAGHWNEEGRPDGLLWRSPDLDRLAQFQQRAAWDISP